MSTIPFEDRSNPVDEEVVEFFENLLTLAKAGKVKAVAVIIPTSEEDEETASGTLVLFPKKYSYFSQLGMIEDAKLTIYHESLFGGDSE